MASKLGIHVNEQMYAERLNAFVARAKPAAMLHLNLGDAETPRRWKASSPNTLVFGRKYVGSQPLDNPEARADDFIRRIEGSTCAREGVIDIFSGYNEVGPHITEDYSRFDIQCARRAHDNGWKWIAGSWSVGCPDFLQSDGSPGSWYSSWMHAVLEVCDYMGIHEYCAPRMDDPRGLDHSNPGEGWFTFRYRKVRRILEEQNLGFPLPPFLITECGIDSGACHWDPGAQGGWRSFTDPKGYMSQLAWYDSGLQLDPYIAGATIFCDGTRDPTWNSFDVKGELLDLLENYCLEEMNEPPAGVPYPDWLQDLRAILPTNGEYDQRSLSNIVRIVIHHSGGNPMIGPWQISEFHIGVYGWPGNGYQYLAGVDGAAWQANSLDRSSYHVRGYNNSSVGICMLGDYSNSVPGNSQIEAVRRLIAYIRQRLGRDVEGVGHRELDSERTCPGSLWDVWKDRLVNGSDWQAKYQQSEAERLRLFGLLEAVEDTAEERVMA